VGLLQVERQQTTEQTVLNLLHQLDGLEPLKKLFWSELNYNRVNQALSRKGWVMALPMLSPEIPSFSRLAETTSISFTRDSRRIGCSWVRSAR